MARSPVKMPKEKWEKMITPEAPIEGDEELEKINQVLNRLRELTAILIFRLSDSHSESVGIVRDYRRDLMADVSKMWDQFAVIKFGIEEEDDD